MRSAGGITSNQASVVSAALRAGYRHIDTAAAYQHRVDPDVPMEEVAGTVQELIAAGKVKHRPSRNASQKTSTSSTST